MTEDKNQSPAESETGLGYAAPHHSNATLMTTLAEAENNNALSTGANTESKNSQTAPLGESLPSFKVASSLEPAAVTKEEKTAKVVEKEAGGQPSATEIDTIHPQPIQAKSSIESTPKGLDVGIPATSSHGQVKGVSGSTPASFLPVAQLHRTPEDGVIDGGHRANITTAESSQTQPQNENHENEREDHHADTDADSLDQRVPGSLTGLDIDSQGDADSTLGSLGDFSSTASVRPSVYDFIEENGRRYHRFKEGQYLLPNDEVEQDRLDLQHHMMILSLDGKLHWAPVEDMASGLHNVLDLCTGTGIWAIEFALAFPSANVLGTDLSPIQPEFIPSNCRFEIDDAEDPWLYSHSFDYIHGRALATCFKSHHTVFGHAFDALRPGGYFELQDVIFPGKFVDETGEGSAMKLWCERFVEGGKRLGKDFNKVSHYEHDVAAAGFVNVRRKAIYWPVGTWPRGHKAKTLGAWMREDFLSGLQGASMAVFTRGLGMSPEEIELFLVDVRSEIKSNKIHGYFQVEIVYGQKPL